MYTSPKEIGNIINHAHISKNITLHRDSEDPMLNYTKVLGNKNPGFHLKTISVEELRKVMQKLKPTKSTPWDNIYVKTLKQVQKQLEPALLNLVNMCITQGIYPDNLKCSKVIPILKSEKPPTNPLSYRTINLLPSAGKVIDKVISNQLLKHLDDHELIPQQHHGGRRHRSTTTAVASMLDSWVESIENSEELAVIVLDQSTAYDVIEHNLLIRKLKVLGADENTLKYFKNYLGQRRQSVLVDGFRSDELHVGNMSVIQGSVLSCLLYMVYVLDLPLIFSPKKLTPQENEKDTTPKISTFVDGTVTTTTLQKNTDHQMAVSNTFRKLENYMK